MPWPHSDGPGVAHGRSSSNACGHCEATKTTRPFPKRHTAATAACSCSQQRPNAGGSGLTRGHAVLGLRPPHGLQGTAPANSSPRGCGLAQPRIFSLTWRRQILFENQWTNEQINVDGKTQSYAKSWPENYSTQTPAQAGAELTTSDHGHSARSSAQVLSLSLTPSPWPLISPRTLRLQGFCPHIPHPLWGLASPRSSLHLHSCGRMSHLSQWGRPPWLQLPQDRATLHRCIPWRNHTKGHCQEVPILPGADTLRGSQRRGPTRTTWPSALHLGVVCKPLTVCHSFP